MKFSELPIGAKFRLHRRGLEHTKESDSQYPAEVEVVYNEPYEPAPPPADVPTGRYNIVEMGKDSVRLDGTFTLEQLEAVMEALKRRKR